MRVPVSNRLRCKTFGGTRSSMRGCSNLVGEGGLGFTFRLLIAPADFAQKRNGTARKTLCFGTTSQRNSRMLVPQKELKGSPLPIHGLICAAWCFPIILATTVKY